VGYSAALLNYFLRATYLLSLNLAEIANRSPDEVMEGSFTLLSEVAESHGGDGTRQLEAQWAFTISPQQIQPVDLPRVSSDLTFGVNCFVVFRGRLGSNADIIASPRHPCPHQEPPPRPPTATPSAIDGTGG
jgi:hypothetical protein